MNISTVTAQINCPYCAENFEIIVDPSEPYQDYIEDCYVCCRPIALSVSVANSGEIAVVARDENEC